MGGEHIARGWVGSISRGWAYRERDGEHIGDGWGAYRGWVGEHIGDGTGSI